MFKVRNEPPAPLLVNITNCRFQALIGVGGIGAGLFFALNDDHTLSREESRSGHFLDQRDYCKLHIIAHYVQTLLGPQFTTLPIGRVGDDDAGRKLIDEMKTCGMDTRFVKVCPDAKTLMSICLIYPDGTGGNLTMDDSACSRVDAQVVSEAGAEFARFTWRGVALAAPEVSLAARQKLLQLGTQHHFFRAAAFTTSEIHPAIEMGLLGMTDLLGINLDEATALASRTAEGTMPEAVVEATVGRLRELNPGIQVSITAGKQGSWAWDGKSLAYLPALPVEVASTAGAGDAHLAGLIVGLAAGLEMHQAHELATLVAALSVTSPHTINPYVDRDLLRGLAERVGMPVSNEVRALLGENREEKERQ